jgi:hypothetical protein
MPCPAEGEGLRVLRRPVHAGLTGSITERR